MVSGGPVSLLAMRKTLLLSGLSIMFGTNQVMLTESSNAMSGVDEEPARLVQPVEESQRRLLSIVRVEFCQAQAARISPLWRRIDVGYLPRPDESRPWAFRW